MTKSLEFVVRAYAPMAVFLDLPSLAWLNAIYYLNTTVLKEDTTFVERVPLNCSNLNL
jgi:hypothetical protein